MEKDRELRENILYGSKNLQEIERKAFSNKWVRGIDSRGSRKNILLTAEEQKRHSIIVEIARALYTTMEGAENKESLQRHLKYFRNRYKDDVEVMQALSVVEKETMKIRHGHIPTPAKSGAGERKGKGEKMTTEKDGVEKSEETKWERFREHEREFFAAELPRVRRAEERHFGGLRKNERRTM